MIHELAQFAQQIPDESLSHLLSPHIGLHIRIHIGEEANGRIFLEGQSFQIEYFNGKTEKSDFLLWCADRANIAWCINTNKCFDLPAKGLHSCSPYCLAMKRESLPGGAKYEKDKVKITDRFDRYFENAFELVEENSERERLQLWRYFFKDTERFISFLGQLEGYKKVKEKEYVLFYLDEAREKYLEANGKYLASRLFNTEAYNVAHPENPEELLGTSDFHHGYNSKKPFLEHKSATFDINGRISSSVAKSLYRFSNLMKFPIFPRPLPIFVNEAERKALQQRFNQIAALQFDGRNRPSHRSVMEKLIKERQGEGIGNYYLLFHARGEILDFDFVPKFEYELRNKDGRYWRVESLFTPKQAGMDLKNVFDLQDLVLPEIFNNALVTKRRDKPSIYHWFDEVKQSSYVNASTVYLVQTYRKAFYDFIYKSRRTVIPFSVFDRIMRLSILDDIRLDRIENNEHSNNFSIWRKLDIWFSLYENFIASPSNTISMVNQTQALRDFVVNLTDTENNQLIETEAEYAFAAGQLIRYLFSKISSGKQPHSQLEPFLRAKTNSQFKQGLVKLFDKYKHENFSRAFNRVFSQVMASDMDKISTDFLPLLLAGYFSENLLFSKFSENDD